MNLKLQFIHLVGASLLIGCKGLASFETRRGFVGLLGGACTGCVANSALADVDVDGFLQSGMVAMPMVRTNSIDSRVLTSHC